MTRVLAPPRVPPSSASPELRHAAEIARDAARLLGGMDLLDERSPRLLHAAERLTSALDSPRISHLRLLMASPAVIERSGQMRTLIEMIEAEPGDDEARLRLARLLLRALVWLPETFPDPTY